MKKPDFSYEKKYWGKGFDLVVGVDEVGRGSLAGPVIAGAVAIKIQNPKSKIRYKNTYTKSQIIQKIIGLRIDDSKRLSAKRREELTPIINQLFYTGIGRANVAEINKSGIVMATQKAMKQAVHNVIKKISNIEYRNPKQSNKNPKSKSIIKKLKVIVLIDGNRRIYSAEETGIKQETIVHGDQKSISIAAGSIIAKVYRDKLMTKLARKYKKYKWEKNKGYGTKFHFLALNKFGITKFHREGFVDVCCFLQKK